jgi:uncharacterized protein YidB (DUF937 family)
LNLSAADPGTDPITSWTINWGDGTTEPVAGNPSSVSHSYALVHRTYDISAQATNADGTFTAGNTVSLNMALATDNENYIAQVYEDLLNRAPELGGLQNWTDHLAAGASRQQVMEWIMISPEYRTLFVQGVYQNFLGRPADPQGLRTDVLALDAGATADHVKAMVLGSDEFFNARASGSTTGFFAALYHDVLGRSGTPSEIQSWVSMEPASFARVPAAESFLATDEANQVLAQGFYQKFLHRAADTEGLNTLVQARKNGATMEDVIASVLASDEYFKQAIA